MRKILCIGGFLIMTCIYAQNKDPHFYSFMSASDMRNNSLSNITITNNTTQPITTYGLYIASIDTDDCSVCTGSVIAGDNLGGAIVSPVNFKVNQSVPIGQNYLYNMIYNGIYYARANIGSPCLLPGCSWPGDLTIKGWCLTINAVSLNSNYTFSTYTRTGYPPARTPPYSIAGNSSPLQFNYRYDLIDPNTLGSGSACLGLITCDDKTLTCKDATVQNETFQPYS